MPIATNDLILKLNAIRLAEHHRQHCDGATCNISLSLLLELLEAAGVEVTRDELQHFI